MCRGIGIKDLRKEELRHVIHALCTILEIPSPHVLPDLPKEELMILAKHLRNKIPNRERVDSRLSWGYLSNVRENEIEEIKKSLKEEKK